MDVSATATGNAVEVRWRRIDEGAGQFHVLRRESWPETWMVIGIIDLELRSTQKSFSYADTTGEQGHIYVYGIRAQNWYGTQGTIVRSSLVLLP